jgi:hypothetical protein
MRTGSNAFTPVTAIVDYACVEEMAIRFHFAFQSLLGL